MTKSEAVAIVESNFAPGPVRDLLAALIDSSTLPNEAPPVEDPQ